MSVDIESFTIILSFSCMTSRPWVSLNASWADQCGAGRNRNKGLTLVHRTSRGDTPSAPRSRYLLTPTHTNTDTTHKNFPRASIPSPLAYTHSRESLAVTSYSSLSLDVSHFSCYLSHAPSPRRPLYPCLSWIRNTHTYLSRPCQIHQLHIHTCYITYPIERLFRIPHSFWIKCGQKIILEFLHIYNITKLYGGVWTLICIVWCP